MTAFRHLNREYNPHPKVLLVEGVTEMRLIPELMESNGVAWDNDWRKAPIQIRDMDGKSNIQKREVIGLQIAETHRQATGILLDADDDLHSRWQAIRSCCQPYFPKLTKELPAGGTITTNPDGQRLGIWIMPDNKSSGMLETFLLNLVNPRNEDGDRLLQFARDSTKNAKAEFHAPFKSTHFDKASIHTWLAWRDEPGRQLHDAVKFQILHPASPYAQPFVKWFRELFEV